MMEVARQAEKLISQQLIRQGWVVMAQNYRRVGVEVDIIAQKADTVIAVEVKARRRPPELSRLFHPRQLGRIKGRLAQFLAERSIPYQTLRVDGALVLYRLPWRVVSMRYWVNIGENLR